MKILMLSPVSPFPSNTGGLVRIAQIHSGLCQYHDVTLVFPSVESDRGFRSNQNVWKISIQQPNRLHKVKALFSKNPYHQTLYYKPLMREKIRELLAIEKFDLIYAHSIYTLSYVAAVKNVPIIVDQQNVDREYWMNKSNAPSASFFYRTICRINRRKVINFERGMQKNLTGYVSVSLRDREITMGYAEKNVKHFIIAPNGVDTKHYKQKQYLDNPGKITLGFLGSLDLEINQSAVNHLCQKILPLVRSRLPALLVSVLLIGRNPPTWLREEFKSDRSIVFSGTVEDLHPYLRTVDILCLPLDQGAGTKLRVLEAMSVGIPIVGNSFAFIGIDEVLSGENVICAADDNSFATHICQLALDFENRKRLGCAARELVTASYDWTMIINNLDEELKAIVEDVNSLS